MSTPALFHLGLSLVAQAPLPPCAVQGRVVDPAGRPVVGAAVALVLPGQEVSVPALRARTDGKGAFRLRAAQGNYALTVTHPAWKAAYLSTVEIKGSALALPPVPLTAGGELLEGRIEAADGVDLRRVRLALVRISQDSGDIFLVDLHQGAFNVRLPEGEYLPIGEGARVRRPGRFFVGREPRGVTFKLETVPSAAPASVRGWIKSHAVPLVGVEAGHGFQDLAPLAKRIGRARVVSLGEATHGTREFFQMKHRMLEYLVSEHGFTAFAIEANLPECQALNEYVLTGKGDPKQGLDGIYFWTWNTEEVLALIEWMRAWNADPAHTRKVRFYGFDNQTATQAYAFVHERLVQEDPDLAAWMEKELSPLQQGLFTRISDSVQAKALREAAAELGRRLDAKRDFDPFLRRCARVIEQKLDIDLEPNGGYIARDVGMAENVQWILQQEGPEGRIMLWAHNAHVQFGNDVEGHAWMGGHLRKALGDEMVVFGFAFWEGAFQAVDNASEGGGLREFTVKGLGTATLDEALASAGSPVLALDFRELPKHGSVQKWFSGAQGTFDVGAVFREGSERAVIAPIHVAQTYDGLLFIAHTTAARPNHGRSASKPKARNLQDLLPVPINLDFEESLANGAPKGWFGAPLRGYDASLERAGAHEGHRWLRLKRRSGETEDSTWGTLMQVVDAKALRGKRVRLSGWLQASDGAKASLWLRVDRAEGAQGFFDNALERAVTQGAWTQLVVEGLVAEDAEALNFGALIDGPGSAGFDGLRLEVLD